ncbi:OLC1v1036267C1 [Oldenlandia corymbosa var. corymbosa]|uniref:Cysteine proteinase inhibitor n=1 Tax=Oldenlandia corymbosa var. corymbosa TaxID=529605 RepID=A0AAV1CW47_OLDCO|nr:OLC1v1036267C1 [Oldenlandia corymbosa var. corymbosa]
MKTNGSAFRFSVVLLALFLCWESGMVCSLSVKGLIRMRDGGVLGGIGHYGGTQNNGEIESLGRFAVQEHNKNENALLEFGRVIKAKEQVVSGMLYHLTLEVVDAGKKKIYEAKVWVKPWINFKKLEEFKHISYVSPLASSVN